MSETQWGSRSSWGGGRRGRGGGGSDVYHESDMEEEKGIERGARENKSTYW